jgi:hypothetical protein
MRPTYSFRIVCALASIALALVAAGCSSDNTGGESSSPSENTYVEGTNISDARAWRDDLLEIAKSSYDKGNKKSNSRGIVEAWQSAYPAVLTADQVVGFAIDPPNNGISGFALVLDKANDGEMLPFRVTDANGNCAAGVVRVTFDDVVSTEALGDCSEIDNL